ncbi:MAG TPA: lipid-A-disaccharide synthase [Halothiobacillaceae bacterium]|nr:lipid-A-disaccharide synthase [Halothiobacillaceae bacterium]
MVDDMAAQRPQVLIAIDFQEFNQRLARKARALGIPVVFFIAPQVWAWRPRRVRKAPQYADHIATLFAFEKPLFAPYVRTTHVGHPLVDNIAQFLSEHHNTPQKDQIGLLPGSRYSEIKRLLPVFLKTAHRLWQTDNSRHFVLPKAENIDAQWFSALVDQYLPDPAFKSAVCIYHGQSRLVMQQSRLLLIASGTATLEAGLIGTPMIIGYKTSALTYAIGKLMIKTQHIGLPNIISQREIVPELIQNQLTVSELTQAAEVLLTDETAYLQQKKNLAALEKQLGEPGAIKRLAGLINDYLRQPRLTGGQSD